MKPVEAIKIRTDYDGLVIRCAFGSEREQIFTRAGLSSHRALILEAPDEPDYVITAAFGWREDQRDERDPSDLAFFPPGTDPTRLLPQDASSAQR